MSESEPVISLQNVRKSFDGRVVLDDVTFDVMRGQTIVIMGGSGCGKSTTLRMIIGSFKPDSGSIKLYGQDVTSADEAQLNNLRKKFGILFQSGALFNSMTIAQNVALPLQEHTELDPLTIEIMVKIKLELVGLREHADKFPAQISGGMKKRAGLARALALDPQILFYDEPSAGLDPVTSAEIDQLIIDLSRKLHVTSVVVTHEMDSAFTIADRMVMLDKGRVLAVEDRQWFEKLRDTKGELPEDQALIRQFLRGDPVGPITQRKQTTGYAEDLLGEVPVPRKAVPSIVASRTT
ncbi:MAG: ATP-binding cassette domain-containing protein [Planctomycetes bacterium]|nr:ATP-binding cassette domain-containing protein [Planctomycetota bacterium]